MEAVVSEEAASSDEAPEPEVVEASVVFRNKLLSLSPLTEPEVGPLILS